MENNKNNSGAALAKKMAVSLVCGLVAGFAFMMLREKLNASGNSALWKTINDLLFQDITAEGAEQAFGIFYIIGQLFITEIAYEFFNVQPMLHTADWHFNASGALDLLIIVAASSLVLWVREVYHLFVRKEPAMK